MKHKIHFFETQRSNCWFVCGPQLTVVGVHSAKFDNEKDSGAIRNAILRYDVTHPVSRSYSFSLISSSKSHLATLSISFCFALFGWIRTRPLLHYPNFVFLIKSSSILSFMCFRCIPIYSLLLCRMYIKWWWDGFVPWQVVNDGEMTMWRQLGVSSWPTLALVSPKGRVIAMLAGEGHRQVLSCTPDYSSCIKTSSSLFTISSKTLSYSHRT